MATPGSHSHAVARAALSRARYYGTRLLRRTRALRDAAVAVDVLAPAEVARTSPLRMPAGHADRIAGVFEGDSIAAVAQRLRATSLHHAATEAITIKDAALFGHLLFGGGAKLDLLRSERSRRDHEPLAVLDHVALVSTYAGTRWFGHFIHDDLPQELLAQSIGERAVMHARPAYSDEPTYRALFQLPRPPAPTSFIARRCTVFVDYAQNASKRDRYARMRAHVKRAPGNATRVYVRRLGGATRALRDEAALVDALVRRGYVVTGNGAPAGELADVCSRAAQLVSLDGSHIAPLLFVMPEGAELVSLMPACRVTTTISDVARANQLRAAMFLCDGPEDALAVDLDALLRFLDA